MKQGALFICLLALANACDVPVLRPNETGVGNASGVVVAATDLVQSANIGLVDRSGFVLSDSVFSTASAKTGFSTALGGDLAFPSSPPASSEVVLLDRYPRSVITWLDVSTDAPRVRAQLSVATGFAANLHDYVAISREKAFVTRFDSNALPGREPFDAGGDLLVIDPSVPAILRRIDIGAVLTRDGAYFAHPDRARLINGLVYVVVPFYDASHRSGASFIAVIDPDSEQVIAQFRFDGVTGCSGLDVSPDGQSLAVACSGTWQGVLRASSGASAIVGVAIEPNLHEIWRVGTGSDARAFAFGVSYVDATHVIAARLGDLGPPIINDAVQLIDVRTQSATTLFESAAQPASIGIGPCDPEHAQCFIADASRGQVVRLDLSSTGEHRLTVFGWNDPLGLRPRTLAFFGTGPE